MHFAILTAMKDIRRVLRDPVGLLTWIAMPAVITGLVSLISTGSPVPHGTLLVVDHDQSLVSRAIVLAFSREPVDKMVTIERLDADAARRKIDAGEASALLEIPRGFGQAFARREKTTLALIVNPGQRIVPKVIEEVLSGSLEAGFYIQTGFRANLDQERLGFAMTQLSRGKSSLTTTIIGQKREPLNLPALFFPGMLILAVFGLGQSLSLDWWAERTAGTLRRTIVAPEPLFQCVAGKTVALGVLSGGLALIGMTASRFLVKAPSANFLLAVLWVAAAAVALYLMNSLLQMPAADQRSGLVLNQFVLFLLSMIGGSFFPFEMMPQWLAKIGRFTPNGFAIATFKSLTVGDASKALPGFLYLTLLIAAEFWLLSRRLRRWAV